MADLTSRPNIRVEIRNNLVEPMEVDDLDRTLTGDFEEGEINEPNEVVSANTNDQSTTTLNIFGKEKLLERAKRFDLKPDEVVIFTEQELNKLYKSLGVTDENRKEIRFDTVHMRGTQEMSTEDVLNYFYKFAPNSVEWIDDESCNIVWTENESAARALYFTSKPISDMPVRGPCNPFIKELDVDIDDTPKGTSILLKNKNREVQLKEDDNSEDVPEKDADAVDLAQITCPIPPGYWRLGAEHPKGKNILLRYAFRTDKKPFKAERFSEYYRKHGNPNYGNLKGIISDTHKKKLKGIFDRNHDINKDSGKNPWGSLAENWDEDVQFREPEFMLPKLQNKENKSIMNRLGFKRGLNENEGDGGEVKKNRVKIPRMRMYADEEEAKLKKKKQMAVVKQENDLKPTDLRNILGKNTRPVVIKLEEPEEKMVDLGTKLKNRHKQTVKKEYLRDYEEEEELRQHSYKTEKRHKESSNKRHKEYYENKYEDEETEYDNRTRSKVTVVVKRQRQPLVASTILPRQKITERTRPHRRQSSESSESSSSSSSSSTTTSSNSESSSDEESESPKRTSKALQRPGFKNDLKLLGDDMGNHKSPLRIEISNDLFKKK